MEGKKEGRKDVRIYVEFFWGGCWGGEIFEDETSFDGVSIGVREPFVV